MFCVLPSRDADTAVCCSISNHQDGLAGILFGDTPPHRRRRAAHYLLRAKRADGTPHDPVARFHLGNGALVHAVHADADLSANGTAQSDGTMVKYLYDLSLISRNHERYAAAQEVAASPDVIALADAGTAESAQGVSHGKPAL